MLVRRMKTKTKVFLAVVFGFICVNLAMFLTNDSSSSSHTQSRSSFEVHRVDISREKSYFNTTTEKPIWQKDIDSEDAILFTSVSAAHAYMRSVTSLSSAKRVIIHYGNFSRHWPQFIDDSDREYFMMSPVNEENMIPILPERLRGVVGVIPNGTFQMDYTCGYGSDNDFFRKERSESEFIKEFDTLVPLVIPMGFLFQHFFDGTFPKMVQAFEYIKRPETKILLERPNHDNVYRILEKLNISQDKVVWHRRNDVRTVYKAKYMITTCIAPPLHPLLWQHMRSLLGVPESLATAKNESLIMLLTRAGATNGGRSALNLNDVYDYLSKRYGNRVVLFDSTFNLQQAMDVFSKVSIIIGTHGGSFYNMNYAPRDTTIIEFVPYDYGGRDIRALPHAIFWAMADLLGQPYWRVMCKSENYQHDMNMDIKKLDGILDVVDPATKLKAQL